MVSVSRRPFVFVSGSYLTKNVRTVTSAPTIAGGRTVAIGPQTGGPLTRACPGSGQHATGAPRRTCCRQVSGLIGSSSGSLVRRSSERISVHGKDGQPLVELLGRENESVIGAGQKARPGRLSMYAGNGQNTVNLTTANATLTLGGAGADGTVSVHGKDGQPRRRCCGKGSSLARRFSTSKRGCGVGGAGGRGGRSFRSGGRTRRRQVGPPGVERSACASCSPSVAEGRQIVLLPGGLLN